MSDSNWAVSLFGAVYYAVQSDGAFFSLWVKPWCVIIQTKANERYVHVVLFIMLRKVVLTFKSVDQTLGCDHSNESLHTAR